MAQLFVKRIGNALMPDGDASIEAFAAIPFGKSLRCEVTQPRNIKHHRLFFKLCARIASGIGHTTEFVERAFKIELGYFSHYVLGDGRDVLVLGSIAFSKMDQIAFDRFWKDCVRVMFEKWQIAPEAVNDLLEDKRYGPADPQPQPVRENT